MTQITKLLGTALIAAAIFTSCKKDAKETKAPEIPQDVISQIQKLGFNTDNVQKTDEGYIVEGDILLTQSELSDLPTSNEIVYAQEEHYRTTNLVGGLPRTITVSLNTTQANFIAATDEAIRRYNALNLRVRFQRVSSGGNIRIVTFFENSNILGSAGFPSGGNPFGQIRMNTRFYTPGAAVNPLATTIAHEMGHCIGFRHTDFMNRSFSCGGVAVNEGSGGVGAIYISGTPTGPSAGSWMLACGSTTTNRPFTTADRTALNVVY
jgi:Dual-action HEIGH metallo-peptidase